MSFFCDNFFMGTDGNLVINNVIGLAPRGDRRLPNRRHGLDVNYGAASNVLGGTGPGERNVVSGNSGTGIELSHGERTSQNRIVGNFIGTDVTGTWAPPHTSNKYHGVVVKDRVRNNLVADNVIGNNRLGGLKIDNYGTCCVSGNQIMNNRIGVSLDDRPIPNRAYGVAVFAPDSRIGPGNVIAFNPIGIMIEGDDSDRNTVTRNSIYGNAGLGIDLAPIGVVNDNDAGDGDRGPNEQLNFPLLSNATPQAVTGTACAGCTIEIFIADRGSRAHGQGKTLIGVGTVNESGIFFLPISGVNAGEYLTATATDADGNTSEFALNLLVTGGSTPTPTGTPTSTPMPTGVATSTPPATPTSMPTAVVKFEWQIYFPLAARAD